MSSSSTVCDMLTAVRNGIALRKQTVDVVDSRLNRNVLDALKRAGYIWDLSQVDVDGRSRVRVVLKYGPDGSSVMRSIVSVSKPGNRVYSRVDRIPFVLQGLGISLVSTNRGVLSDSEARAQRVGGEIICKVY